MPAADTAGAEGFNSVRQLRRAGLALLATLALFTPVVIHAQLSSADAARIFEIEDRSALMQSRLAWARKKIEAEARKRRPGIVYKNPRFWSSLPGFGLGIDIFDGNFGAVENGTFRQFYLDFFGRLSADCGAEVRAAPHVEFPQYSRTVWKRDDGTIESAGAWSKSGAVVVETRFARTYSEYLNQPNVQRELSVIGGIFSTLLTGDRGGLSAIPELAREILLTQAAIRRFNSQGCDSPPIAQLKENLHRFAQHEKSGQAAGIEIPNAQAYSDPLPDAAEFIALEDACADYYLGRNKDWCNCLAPRIRQSFPIDVVLGHVRNFESLHRALSRDGSRERDSVRSCIR